MFGRPDTVDIRLRYECQPQTGRPTFETTHMVKRYENINLFHDLVDLVFAFPFDRLAGDLPEG